MKPEAMAPKELPQAPLEPLEGHRVIELPVARGQSTREIVRGTEFNLLREDTIIYSQTVWREAGILTGLIHEARKILLRRDLKKAIGTLTTKNTRVNLD